MANPLDPLAALQYLDFSRLYDKFQAAIDFIIFFTLFFGLAKVTIGKRFEDRGGNAMCVGVSAALTIGMLIAETKFNFTIAAFGGVAILAIIAILALLAFIMFRSFELDMAMSLSLTFLLLFFGMNSVPNDITQHFIRQFPSLHFLMFLAFIISVLVVGLKLLKHIMPKMPFRSVVIKKQKIPDVNRPGKAELKEEERAAKDVRKETKIELKESKTIASILKHIIRWLEKDGLTDENRPEIAKAITRINNAEHEIEVEIQRQKEQFARLESSTDTEIRKAVAALEQMQGAAIGRVRDFKYLLQESIACLRNNDVPGAVWHLADARETELKLGKVLRKLKRQERLVLGLIKRDKKKAV